MSRKVLSNGVQTPLADMSSRTYVLYLNTKLFIFLTLVGMLALVNCVADGKILSIDTVTTVYNSIHAFRNYHYLTSENFLCSLDHSRDNPLCNPVSD